MGLAKFLGIDAETYIKEKEEIREYEAKERERKGLSPKFGPSSKNNATTKIALLNMLSTDDLDQVFADCAPMLSNAIHENNVKVNNVLQILESRKEADELQGRYDELQKRYDELKAERDKLLEIIAKK